MTTNTNPSSTPIAQRLANMRGQSPRRPSTNVAAQAQKTPAKAQTPATNHTVTPLAQPASPRASVRPSTSANTRASRMPAPSSATQIEAKTPHLERSPSKGAQIENTSSQGVSLSHSKKIEPRGVQQAAQKTSNVSKRPKTVIPNTSDVSMDAQMDYPPMTGDDVGDVPPNFYDPSEFESSNSSPFANIPPQHERSLEELQAYYQNEWRDASRPPGSSASPQEWEAMRNRFPEHQIFELHYQGKKWMCATSPINGNYIHQNLFSNALITDASTLHQSAGYNQTYTLARFDKAQNPEGTTLALTPGTKPQEELHIVKRTTDILPYMRGIGWQHYGEVQELAQFSIPLEELQEQMQMTQVDNEASAKNTHEAEKKL